MHVHDLRLIVSDEYRERAKWDG